MYRMPYFKLIILAVTAANHIAAQSVKSGEVQIPDVNSESRKGETESEIQNDIEIQRNSFNALKKQYPDRIKLQKNTGDTEILYNRQKNLAAVSPPLVQFLYSHGTMKFPNKHIPHTPRAFSPQKSFPNSRPPNAVAGFVIAYSPTQAQTTWNSSPMSREQVLDEQIDPLAVEESQIFIEIAQPGQQTQGKQSQYTQPAGGQMQIVTESSNVKEPVQFITSTNSGNLVAKTNRLGYIVNPESQAIVGVQQQPVVVNAASSLQQQPAIVNTVGTFQQQPLTAGVGTLQQQQLNTAAVQNPQIAIGNTAGTYRHSVVGRSGNMIPQHPPVHPPQHPPVVSGFPTFSITFDPLNFLLGLLGSIPIPKLNLDGRTFFGVELKKGFKFPPGPMGSEIQAAAQQQPYRRGTVIQLG